MNPEIEIGLDSLEFALTDAFNCSIALFGFSLSENFYYLLDIFSYLRWNSKEASYYSFQVI